MGDKKTNSPNREPEVVLDTRAKAPSRKPLITFIVSFFNTENYILEALDSIVRRGYGDIELIIINDGSRDNSHKVVLKWIEDNQAQALYICQENSGLSMARMLGIQYALGEYIGFCDSDDYLNIDSYIRMAQVARDQSVEVACCKLVLFNNYSNQISSSFMLYVWDQLLGNKSHKFTNICVDPKILLLEVGAGFKLIQRKFLLENQISFPCNLKMEDFPYHVKALILASKVLLYNSVGYFYRRDREGQITENYGSQSFDIFKVANFALKATKDVELGKAQRAYILSHVIDYFLFCGRYTFYTARFDFFQESISFIQDHFDINEVQADLQIFLAEYQRIFLAAVYSNAINFLVGTSSQNHLRIFDNLPLLLHRKLGKTYRKKFIRIFVQRLLRIPKAMVRLLLKKAKRIVGRIRSLD